jgi:cardiolipin synthase A/B
LMRGKDFRNTLRICAAIFVWSLFSGCASDKVLRQTASNCPPANDPRFEMLLDKLAGVKLVGGSSVNELVNGEKFFPAMTESIRGAQHSIHFENFVWRSGEVSNGFIEGLSERARAGVKVHFLVDALGSGKLETEDLKKLRDAGVEVAKYNRVSLPTIFRISHRTHRKILIVDGKIGFVGGISIADEWLCDTKVPSRWRDSNYEIKGPAVAQLQKIFATNWAETTGIATTCADCFPQVGSVGDCETACFMSGPEEGERNARRILLLSIAAARKNIRIAHSYFIPDNFAMTLLLDARKRGVKVEILTPGKANLNFVRRASRSRWKQLLDAGVEFYEYQPTKYHLKLMIVDDVWVTAGSINFDARSFWINDEANFIAHNKEFAATQIATFEADKSKSRQVDPKEFSQRPWRAKFMEHTLGLLRFEF